MRPKVAIYCASAVLDNLGLAQVCVCLIGFAFVCFAGRRLVLTAALLAALRAIGEMNATCTYNLTLGPNGVSIHGGL